LSFAWEGFPSLLCLSLRSFSSFLIPLSFSSCVVSGGVVSALSYSFSSSLLRRVVSHRLTLSLSLLVTRFSPLDGPTSALDFGSIFDESFSRGDPPQVLLGSIFPWARLGHGQAVSARIGPLQHHQQAVNDLVQYRSHGCSRRALLSPW
jgi:hypothetical protein